MAWTTVISHLLCTSFNWNAKFGIRVIKSQNTVSLHNSPLSHVVTLRCFAFFALVCGVHRHSAVNSGTSIGNGFLITEMNSYGRFPEVFLLLFMHILK
jgi:hypothetical protein